MFVPAAEAGCRIGPHHPIEAALEALAECPSLPALCRDFVIVNTGMEDRHSRAAVAARRAPRVPNVPVRD